MKKHNKIIFSAVILFVILTFINIAYAIVLEDSNKYISGILYNYLDNNTNVLIVSPKESNNLSYSEVESMFTNSDKKVKSIKDKNNNLLLTTESNIPTGATVTTEDNEYFKVIFYGDSNGDGIICSAQDVEVIKNDYLNRQKASGVYKIAGNLCVDSKLNVKDIQKMLLKKKGELDTGIVDKFPDEDTTHYATFMADGKEVAKIEFTVGDGLSEDEPEVPEKPGYTKKWSEYTLIGLDMTIEAEYTPIVYNITYETNEGTFEEEYPKITYTVEDENKNLPIPEKANYVFEGWYETEDCIGNKVETTEGKFGDLTLYAKYEEAKYKNNLNKYYLTLKDAMDYANTKSIVTTIMPLVNVTETQAPIYRGTQSLTLNLNEKTITLNGVTLTNNKILTISGEGTLTGSGADTIKNEGTLEKNTGTKIENTSTANYCVINNRGTVNISAGTIESNYRGIYNYENGKVTISGGTLTAVNNVIRNYGNANEEILPAVKISGNPILESTKVNTIVNDPSATGLIYIDGGTINSTNPEASNPTVINNGNGKVLITKGTIKCSGKNAVVYNGYNNGNGAGIVEIRGGTIESDTAVGVKNSEKGNVKISGGTITTNAQHAVNNNGVGTIEISGGTVTNTGISTGTHLTISNLSTGLVKVTSGKLTSVNDTCLYNSSAGTIDVSGGTITANESGIYNRSAGTIIVSGGTILSKNKGITNYADVTLTLGKNDSSVSITNPSITGNTIGVSVNEEGKFNFYDGIIKGSSGNSISGTVTATPKGYVVVKGTETIDDTKYETSVLGPSAPVITAKLNNTSGGAYTSGTWTNQNVYVSLASSNVGAGIKEYQWYENNEWVTRAVTTTNNKGTITYTVNRNETLRFRAVDNNGVISEEVTLTVKIDKTLPTVILGTDGGTYTISADSSNVSISTKLTASDTGGSELKSIAYAWSQSNSTEPTSYTVVENNATVTKSATGGNWYLWTKVLDNAGNRATSVKTSKVYTVKYQIAYNANGGSGAPSSQTKIHETALTLSTTVPTRTGYTFNGWATSKTATTSEYQAGGSYTLNSAKTLYAVWKSDTNTKYVVNHYVHDLGTNTYTLNSTDNKTGTTASSITLSTLKKTIPGFTYVDGYITGDTTKPTSGAVTTATILADGTRVINLYYRRNYLYIQYDMNGGSLSSSHGTGYATEGTLVTYNSSKTYLRGVYGSKVGAVNTTTYAVDTSGLHNYNNSVAINIVKTGYTAKSGAQWNSKADGTGTGYNHDTSTYDANGFAGADLSTGDKTVTIYVNWTANTYTITYDNNYMDNDIYGNKPLTTAFSSAGAATGTTSRVENTSAKYGQEIRYTVTKAGTGGAHLSPGRLTVGNTYTWSVYLKASKNVTINLGQEQNGRKTVNLTTSWQRFTYTFTAGDTQYNSFTFYTTGDGWAVGDVMYMHSLELKETSSLNITTQSKTYGTTLGTLPTVSRAGYTLQGWYTAPVGGTKISSSTTVPAGNTTYYAQWTANIPKITIKENGANASTTGYSVSLSTSNSSDTATYTATSSSATVSISAVTNGTYYIWSGKSSNAKTTRIYSGVSITVNNNSPTGTINYYGLTLAKGTGISEVSNGGTSTTSAVQYLYNSSSVQTIAIDATVSDGYTWSTWTKSSGTNLATFTAATKSQNVKMGAGAATLTASAKYTATPTITRSDYNTFTYTASGAGAYYVSTSATAPAAGTAAASSTFALNTWTTATNTGNLTLAENTTYYVYVKNAATGGSVSANKASIAVRKITRSQGTGTTLTTRYDATTETTGTALTADSILVLNGTPFWAKATASSGYRGIALKHGSTAITATGGTFNAGASESIASTATANKVTITINKDGSGWSASGIRVDLYQSGASKKNVTSSSGTTAVLSAVPNGTYDVYAGKNSGAKTTLIDNSK